MHAVRVCGGVCVCVMGSHGCDECQPAGSSAPTQDHSIVGGVTQEFKCTLYHMLYGSNCATVIHPLCVVCGVCVGYSTLRQTVCWLHV